MTWLNQIRFDDLGLVPVIAQEATTGEVLMLAYANREALERTLATGRAHYWSRSRSKIWAKGETSGNVQHLVEVRIDCDDDAILYRVRQTGPACHTGEVVCFHRVVQQEDVVKRTTAAHILGRVDEVISDRRANHREGAYTNYLFDQGLDKILKKVGEETTEVVIAAKNDDPRELTMESADLLFHLLVLLQERELSLTAVWTELEDRFGRPSRPRATPQQREEDR